MNRTREFSFNRSSILTFSLAAVLLVFLCSTSTRAQSLDNGIPLADAPGTPDGSYALSGFESVNLFNGGLNFSFPALRVGGRGTAGFMLQIPIEQRWVTSKNEEYDYYGNRTVTIYPFPMNVSAWPSYEPIAIGQRLQHWSPGECSIPGLSVTYNWALTTVVITEGDGTEHELVDQSSLGRPTQYPICTANGNFRGKIFVSKDGSGMTFFSDDSLRDSPAGGSAIFSGYLKMRDGTVWRVDRTFTGGQYGRWVGYVSWMRDANGNKITFIRDSDFRLTGITDSLNRQVTIERNVTEAPYGTGDKITYKGSGGASRVIHLTRANLSTALRANFVAQGVRTYKQLFPELDGDDGSFDPIVLNAIWLPDSDGVTRVYRFLYNPYGELARAELPTGGAIEYDWDGGLSDGLADGVLNAGTEVEQIYRRVAFRRMFDQNTLQSSTAYGKPESSTANLGYVTVSQSDADGHQLAMEKHFFDGRASLSLSQSEVTPASLYFSPPYFASPFPSWKDGKEYQTESYAGDGQTLLRRSTQTWEQPAIFWWPGPAESAPTNNPYVKETVTTLADTGQVTKTTHVSPQNGQTMIDQFGNFTDTWNYDYGQGAAGNLLTHLHVEYLTTNNGIDYTNRTSNTSPHMLSLPARQSIYDANEVERGRTTYEYDNYGTMDSFHAPLIDWPALKGVAISGLDSSFTSYYPYRGNVTATTRYFLENNQVTGSITGYAQYDLAGNVVKTIDPRSTAVNIIATTISYDDCFDVTPDAEARTNHAPALLSSANQRSYAFPTIVINAMNQAVYSQFDYYLGRPIDVEDVNGTVASGYSSDALDRPTQLIRGANRTGALKSQTLFSYDDVGRSVTSNSDQINYNDNRLKTQTFYDGLGRTIETRAYETDAQYIAVRQIPFISLQDPDTGVWEAATQSSNPHRPTLGEQALWTTAWADALGRGVKVRTPDYAIARTSYSGNTVTVTDQTGKARKTVSDALTRLTSVYEDPAGLNYFTSYAYDVFGDLTTVTQGSQMRTFAYDSLRRLTSATNPESGTVTYQYDAIGNPIQKSDARLLADNLTHVMGTYTYDPLNRPKTHSYNDGTPPVEYFYDSDVLPVGAPTFTRGSSVGRLVAVTYGANSSAGDYFGFDAVGRETLKIQQTGGINYQTTAIYNNSGELTSETYPSGRTVSHTYDQGGRLTSVAGYLGDGTLRNYSTGIIYSPFGGMAKEQFGTDTPVFNKLWYNSRGQLSEIRVSTSYGGDGDTSWNRGAIINHYSDQCWGMCGGANSSTGMTDNNNDLKNQDIYVPNNDQVTGYVTWRDHYDYDSLNRLQRVHEYIDGTHDWQQEYDIDRYGNRLVHQTNTWGTNIPKPNFGRDQANNRLTAPAGYTMTYDAAGNLTTDTYSGQGDRKYDAENHMTQAWSNSRWQIYTYDGNGTRVRRNVNGVETWHVYGLGGELLAEYAPNGSAASPQKEYAYRNGQLLVTASSATTSGYVGCFTDETNRALPVWLGGAETVESCKQKAATAGYLYAGLQWYGECFAGNNVGHVPVAENQCNTPCNANPSEMCGGAWRNSIYQTAADIQWIVTDQLGTPRMIFDKTGSLSSMKRHDYLPFGEELTGQGVRTTTPGYGVYDGLRQQFTQKDRDNETGLDYFTERYYASSAGRFTSADQLGSSLRASNPQSMNRYSYALNNPLRFVDPDGLQTRDPWEQLTEAERQALWGKLEKAKGETDREAFNRIVTDKDDPSATAANVLSIENFIAQAGGLRNSETWQHISAIVRVDAGKEDLNSAVGDPSGRESSNIQIKVDDKAAFLGSLKRDPLNKFLVNGKGDATLKAFGQTYHKFDNARAQTQYRTQPQLHYANDLTDDPKYGPKYFFLHWDPTSSNGAKSTWIGDIRGGLAHGPMAQIGVVRQYLKDTKQAPH